MKVLVKLLFFFSICALSFGVLGPPGEVWSASKGKVVISQAGEVTTLDPHMHSQSFAFAVIRNIYDHLLSRSFDENGKLFHVPMLATSWKAINDTTWIFHLRKGVKFHNGEDFNAESVKYSVERMIDPAQKARYRRFFTKIDRVEIVDPYTVKMTTKGPMPTFVINFGYNMSMLPPKYFKEKGDSYVATHPVGTGPFKFVRWKKDEELVLEANENYWAGPPRIKTLIFKPIPEASTRVAALIGGDVDICQKVPSHLIPMVNNSGIARVMEEPSTQTLNVHLNTIRKSPLQDKRVRQAINYAVDKEGIIKHILEGYGTSRGQPLTPSHFGYDPRIKPYPYDPEKAKALLKEAGYGDGFELTYASSNGRYIKDKDFAEAIVDQLGKVGIKVKLELHEWGHYMQLTNFKNVPREKQPQMNIRGWTGSFDPDGLLSPLLSCEGVRSVWCNKEFDRLLEQGASTISPKKREKIYSQASEIAHDEAAMLFLFCGYKMYGVRNRVQNWKPSPYEALSMYMFDTTLDPAKSPWVKD